MYGKNPKRSGLIGEPITGKLMYITKCVDLILQIILVCENSSNFELLGFHQGVSKQHKIDSTIDNPKHPKLLHNGYVPVFRNVHHHNITLPGWSRVIYQYIL